MEAIKKVVRFFILHDWIWSVAGAFFCYFLLNYGPSVIGGVPIAYYAVNWLQALVAAAGAMAGLMAIARIGMWFNTRILHNWYWKKRDADHPDFKYSSNDFKALTAWQRTVVSSLTFLLFFCFAFFIFLQFLKMA